jgi:hypothetical protein
VKKRRERAAREHEPVPCASPKRLELAAGNGNANAGRTFVAQHPCRILDADDVLDPHPVHHSSSVVVGLRTSSRASLQSCPPFMFVTGDERILFGLQQSTRSISSADPRASRL